MTSQSKDPTPNVTRFFLLKGRVKLVGRLTLFLTFATVALFITASINGFKNAAIKITLGSFVGLLFLAMMLYAKVTDQKEEHLEKDRAVKYTVAGVAEATKTTD